MIRTPADEWSPTPRRSGDARRSRVAIVTVTFQCRDEVLALLSDLEVAREEFDLTVHVVDNASSDGTATAIRRLHPWVDLEALDQNLGFGRACNRGATRADSPVIGFLNPDVRITTHALRLCIDHLLDSPEVAALGPRIVDERGGFDLRCRRGFPTVWALTSHLSGLDRALRMRPTAGYAMSWLDDELATDVASLSGAVMFVRTTAFRALGGFDERFFMYGEDIDLCIRLNRLGWRVRYWPDVEVQHLGGRSGSTRQSQSAWARSLGTINLLHRPSPTGAAAHLALAAAGRLVARTSWAPWRRGAGPGPQ